MPQIPKELRRSSNLDKWIKFRLDEKSYNRLSQVAAIRGTYRSVIVRDAVLKHLDDLAPVNDTH